MAPNGHSSAAPPAAGEAAGPSSTAATFLRHTWAICRKDLVVEARTGEVLVTSAFFAILVVVMSSLAYYLGPQTRKQIAAGVIWLATAFAAVLSLARSWHREREEHAFEGLIAAPVSGSAIFAGKALALCGFLFAIEAVVIPVTSFFFSIDLLEILPAMLLIALCATPGIAATGTLFGVMTVRTGARDLILAIVLFPLLAPTLLAAVVATRLLLDATPLSELSGYLQLMLVFDLTFIAGGLGLFASLAEQ